MRFASIVELKNKTSELVRHVGDGEPVVITKRGAPAAMLIHMTEDELEDWIIENSPKVRAELDGLWEEYLAGAGRPAEEVLAEYEAKHE